MTNGYIETQERIADRWSRWSFEAAKVETCLRQTSEADADRLHELIEEALSQEKGLPFLALSDTTSIAMTPKIVMPLVSWQIEAEAQAEDANDYQNTISGALEKPVFGSAKWFDEIEEVKF